MNPYQRYKGDFIGGLSAAIITLPMSIAYGVTAFGALGNEFMPHAALIGLNAAVFGGFFASLFGGTPLQITGPKAPLTLIITTVVAGLAADPVLSGAGENAPLIILGLVSVCVFIGGATQILSGLLGLGNIVKYIPYPVVAGFMNGIAALLILNQITPFLGIQNGTPFGEALSGISLQNAYPALIGSCTLIGIFLSKRLRLKPPAFLVGLVTGSAIYSILSVILKSSPQIESVGDLQMMVPAPSAFFGLAHLSLDSVSTAWLLKIILFGVVLGIVGSMESLMSAITIDNILDSRHDSKKELIGQGTGNIIASLFGALSAAGSIPRSMANYKAGGRHKLSGLLCSVYILIIFLTMAPLLGKIPLTIFAAIIISVGINLFDRTTFRLFMELRNAAGPRKELAISLLINISVAVVTVCVNLISAVVIGMAISAAYFIVKTGASIIRREYTGQRIGSNKVRSRRQLDLLNGERRRIKIFQLQGPIFFGSADRLAHHLEARMGNADYCILDMRHVNDIDTTGANILVRIYHSLRKKYKWLLISHIGPGHSLWGTLECNGVTQIISPAHFFEDTDNALEWAEDNLLESVGPGNIRSRCTIDQCDITVGFSKDEMEIFKGLLIREQYKKGDTIIFEGNSDRDLFLLTRGSASAKMQLPQAQRQKRLFTFDAGAIFGEMALLDGKPRSARVKAEADAEIYRLPYETYQSILAEQPQIAAKLYRNIALVLSHRLRTRSDELRLFEDD